MRRPPSSRMSPRSADSAAAGAGGLLHHDQQIDYLDVKNIFQALAPIWRFIYCNPIYTGVILYAIIISITHLRTAGRQRGPYVWQVHGANPYHKGSCFCSTTDDYCLCSPNVAIDVVLEYAETKGGEVTALVFVKRKDGLGMAVPGGFVELGETVEAAVHREVLEEIGTKTLHNLRLLGIYSNPARDKRRHTVSITYVGRIYGRVKSGDDVKDVSVIPLKALNINMIKLAFDHNDFLKDYFSNIVGRKNFPREGTTLCVEAPRRPGYVHKEEGVEEEEVEEPKEEEEGEVGGEEEEKEEEVVPKKAQAGGGGLKP